MDDEFRPFTEFCLMNSGLVVNKSYFDQVWLPFEFVLIINSRSYLKPLSFIYLKYEMIPTEILNFIVWGDNFIITLINQRPSLLFIFVSIDETRVFYIVISVTSKMLQKNFRVTLKPYRFQIV